MIIRAKMLNFLTLVILRVFWTSFSDLNFPNNPYGIIRLLESIMDKVMAEIIIIDIQELNPPRNTKTVISVLLKCCGIKME